MSTPEDPRQRLVQLIVRLRAAPETQRRAIVEELLPFLANRHVPSRLRLSAAARAIDALPDSVRAIRGVVRAITAGLPPARALYRLRHLQHLTRKSESLDVLVARRERKVKIDCPHCSARLAHAEMAKHLWHAHGLTLVKGKTRGPSREVDTIRSEYAATGDPALFDRAEEVGGASAIREWAAETASEDEAHTLCLAAGEHGAGLCPTCFAELPPVVRGMPPPLALSQGRIAGDGHSASAGGGFTSRGSATLASATVLVLIGGLIHLRIGLALAAIAYVVTLVVRTPRTSANDLAVDAAWRRLVPRLADRYDATRFLTRLCLTSVGRGDPMERANTLGNLIERARVNPTEWQLLAVAQALRVDDGAHYGRDRAAGIAELVALTFRGEWPATFAEASLGAYFSVPREVAESARLRILLHAAAFTADLTPRDLRGLYDAAPHIAEAMRLPPHHLALLYGVWCDRSTRPWRHAGDAHTVFDLTVSAPTTTGKLLAVEPGILLACDTPAAVEAECGPLLITATGVSLGDVTVIDPAAEVRVANGRRGLVFGRHVLKFGCPIPEDFATELKAWLRFRAEVVAAYPAAHLRSESPASARLLAPFIARCSECGTESLPTPGKIGRTLHE